jgi:hypothetical protein
MTTLNFSRKIEDPQKSETDVDLDSYGSSPFEKQAGQPARTRETKEIIS